MRSLAGAHRLGPLRLVPPKSSPSSPSYSDSPRELLALGVPQLDLQQVVAVVVGGDQREAVLDQLALVDREVGQLCGDDARRRPPAGGPRRASSRPRRRRARASAPITSSHRSRLHCGLPPAVWSVKSDLRGEVARLAALLAGGHVAHVAEQLVPAGGDRGGGHVRAPVPAAVGVPQRSPPARRAPRCVSRQAPATPPAAPRCRRSAQRP